VSTNQCCLGSNLTVRGRRVVRCLKLGSVGLGRLLGCHSHDI
jgi:hypothetical protein